LFLAFINPLVEAVEPLIGGDALIGAP